MRSRSPSTKRRAAGMVYLASDWSSACGTSDISRLSSSNGWNMTPLSDRDGGKFEGKRWRQRGGGPPAGSRLQRAAEFGVDQEAPAQPGRGGSWEEKERVEARGLEGETPWSWRGGDPILEGDTDGGGQAATLKIIPSASAP